MGELSGHVLLVLWGGFAIGLIFGAIGQRIEFCLSGGLREWWSEGRPRRAGAFFLASAVALAGTQLAAGLGWVDLGASIYYPGSFSWLLVPAGGVLFGYGMILARGCGSRALVLLGDGNVRSLLVLLCLGLAAGAMLTGVLAPLRLAVAEATEVALRPGEPSLPGVLASAGLPGGFARAAAAVVAAAGLAGWALFRLRLARHPREAAGAAGIGLLVPAAWMLTGRFGADDFDPMPVESLTFVAPVTDALQYLMLSTGLSLRFGVAVVAGVVLGSAILSLATRSFELRGFESAREVVRMAAGGVLMGGGGALALGCSVGQGLTGLSSLALMSFPAVGGILAGAWLAVRGPEFLRIH
ncbi:MAG: YeeE/YedE family protein [Puniceicoccaceae bacterium]|nr:MAG: YeeE/YedE family protein [Puniceicoccaceae bacterium]